MISFEDIYAGRGATLLDYYYRGTWWVHHIDPQRLAMQLPEHCVAGQCIDRNFDRAMRKIGLIEYTAIVEHGFQVCDFIPKEEKEIRLFRLRKAWLWEIAWRCSTQAQTQFRLAA